MTDLHVLSTASVASNTNPTDSTAPATVQGLLTNVQRFSIHDGPGIRTSVFFKGCPLRCFWCHNPETWRKRPEIQLFPDRCIQCGACLERCERGGHTVEGGQRAYHREVCVACGRCVETCYAEALVLVGRWWSVDELMAELLRDRPFYEQSGGGITLTGGEPLLQRAFSLEILRRARVANLHTAIETCAFAPWEDLAALLPWLDLVMMDIKTMDEAQHRAVTGVSNQLILDNARRLAATEVPLIVRTPVVPTVNDTPAAIGAIAAFIRDFPSLLLYELMPFHRLAESKYRSLGLTYQAAGLSTPPREQMEALAAHARAQGVRAVQIA